MLNFTLITADRLIAVKWPFFYEDRIHTKQSVIAITVVWAITLVHATAIITLFNVLHPHTSRYLGNVIFVIDITGFITLLITNSFVFAKARRQLRATEKITFSIVDLSLEHSCRSNNKDTEFRKKEFRLVRMSIGLILCFFLFWINVLIVTIKMLIYADEIEPPIRIENTITSWYLVCVCYMCNPLWHVALSYDVKRKLKQLCRGKKGVSKNVKSSVTRQKGESQNGGNKKQSTSNFLKNENFLTPDTQEGKKCWLFGKFEVFFFVTSVLRFAFLPYYRQNCLSSNCCIIFLFENFKI